MALKGVEYEYRAVNLIKDGGEQKKEEYVKNKNPMGEVPTFVDGDTVLTQVLSLNSSLLHSINLERIALVRSTDFKTFFNMAEHNVNYISIKWIDC